MSPTYTTWVCMRRRCGTGDYRRVTYDPRWDDFAVFLADMGERPEGTTLDRKNGKGHYCKDNCRWATATEQANNLRTNRVLSIAGFELTVTEWSELVGTARQAIFARLKRGWSAVDAVTRPTDITRRRNA